MITISAPQEQPVNQLVNHQQPSISNSSGNVFARLMI